MSGQTSASYGPKNNLPKNKKHHQVFYLFFEKTVLRVLRGRISPNFLWSNRQNRVIFRRKNLKKYAHLLRRIAKKDKRGMPGLIEFPMVESSKSGHFEKKILTNYASLLRRIAQKDTRGMPDHFEFLIVETSNIGPFLED